MPQWKARLLHHDKRGPLLLFPESPRQVLADVIRENSDQVHTELLDHGALLFRGFTVGGVSEFEKVVDAITPNRLEYLYRSTPRTTVGRNIFTATEFPPQMEIPLHNENAYQRTWPLKLAFCCIVPATHGGQTPIADMRGVSGRIGETLLDEFEVRKVRYVRHYRPYTDLSWQTVFQTKDRNEVEAFCAANCIEFTWLDENTLRTEQVCQGTARHPSTHERIFFNQAHLFHVSSLGALGEHSIINVFGRDRLPRHAYFGDGAEIDTARLAAIREAFVAEMVDVEWQAGDVALLDNMQFAHGRRPFKGERRLIAALLDPHRAS